MSKFISGNRSRQTGVSSVHVQLNPNRCSRHPTDVVLLQGKRVTDVVNRIHVAVPRARDGKARPPVIPAGVQVAKVGQRTSAANRKLQKDIQVWGGRGRRPGLTIRFSALKGGKWISVSCSAGCVVVSNGASSESHCVSSERILRIALTTSRHPC